MILVTVGNSPWDFSRLIRAIDTIAPRLHEAIIMQIGSTEYCPKNAEYFRFVDKKNIDSLHDAARLIITHAGIGSILTALDHHKPFIIVPRMKKYNEMWDDHQIEIANELKKKSHACVIFDVKEIESIISMEISKFEFLSERQDLINELTRYLNSIEA